MILDVYNLSREKVGEIEVSDDVFGAEVRPYLVHRAIIYYLSMWRRGTASTKTRGEVRGGGRKPWRQKGTGRARHGSIRSPIWRGGGVVHGPKPRDFSIKLNKKEKRAALISALSDRAKEGRITVLEDFDLPEIKTKRFCEVKDLFEWKKPLIVIDRWLENLYLSSRNVPKVKVILSKDINVYDVVNSEELVFTKEAIKKVEEVLRP